MYTIKGIDGREYGPVDIDTLKSWTGAGRIRWDTEIHDKASGRRTVAGDMDELRPLLQAVPPLPEEIAVQQASPGIVGSSQERPENGPANLVLVGTVLLVILVFVSLFIHQTRMFRQADFPESYMISPDGTKEPIPAELRRLLSEERRQRGYTPFPGPPSR